MPFCPSCGVSVEAGANTCSKCNTELVSCEKCGHIQIAAGAEGSRMEAEMEQIKAVVERRVKEAERDHQLAMLLELRKLQEEGKRDLDSKISTNQFVVADGVRERREMIEMMAFREYKSEKKKSFEMQCPSCGAELERGGKFCGRCGKALSA